MRCIYADCEAPLSLRRSCRSWCAETRGRSRTFPRAEWDLRVDLRFRAEPRSWTRSRWSPSKTGPRDLTW